MLNSSSASPQLVPQALRNLFNVFIGVDWWLLGATGFLIAVGLNVLHLSQHSQGYYEKQAACAWAGSANSTNP